MSDETRRVSRARRAPTAHARAPFFPTVLSSRRSGCRDRTCPYGDDPVTLTVEGSTSDPPEAQANERQLLEQQRAAERAARDEMPAFDMMAQSNEMAAFQALPDDCDGT